MVAAVILGVALVSRGAVALMPGPRLSDDLYRYVHDGAVLAGGRNPYAVSPAAEHGANRVVPTVTARVNHPKLVTIYQPAAQWVFAGITWIYQVSPTWWKHFDPLRVRTFRLAFSLIDVGLIGLLLFGLARARRPLWWAAIYAWHPLAISEVAWSGHEDVIGIFALVAALLLAQEAAGRRWWLAMGAGAMFAVAAAVKPIVAPVAVVVAWMLFKRPDNAIEGRMIRKRAAAVGLSMFACMAVLAFLYVPFASMPGGLAPMLATVHRFVTGWSFNEGLYGVVVSVLGSAQAGRWFALAVATLVMIWLLLGKGRAWQAALGYLLVALLLSSTVYPWYLLWCLALLPMAMGEGRSAISAGTLVFSLTVAASYVSLVNQQGFAVPGTWRWAEYASVLATMGWGMWWQLTRARGVGRQGSGSFDQA